MTLIIRECVPEDAAACGEICYSAFKLVSDEHRFPPDFPSAAHATEMLARLIDHPGFYGVVAEIDGVVAGSNFLDERSVIAGLGPITIDPSIQNKTVGRKLMAHILKRAAAKNFPGVRLVQAAYHNRSLSLYAKLGFDVQAPLAVMNGDWSRKLIPGYRVRRANHADLTVCNDLCRRVHGHERAGELADAVKDNTATVVEHNGRISGYSTGIAFFGHSVAESNDGLKALICGADIIEGPGILVPSTNSDLLRWCLGENLRVVQTMTLMTLGLFNQPKGSYLASVLY